MGWSDWIALGAALASSAISVASWRWAKASADAAKQANVLQLHSYRESLYIAFHDLSRRFDAEREHISFDHVFAFTRHSKTCFLYVSPPLAEQMKIFFKKVWKITEKQSYLLDVRKRIESSKDDFHLEDQHRAAIAESFELWQELQNLVAEAVPMGREALSSLEDEIRIQLPEPLPLEREKSP